MEDETDSRPLSHVTAESTPRSLFALRQAAASPLGGSRTFNIRKVATASNDIGIEEQEYSSRHSNAFRPAAPAGK